MKEDKNRSDFLKWIQKFGIYGSQDGSNYYDSDIETDVEED